MGKKFMGLDGTGHFWDRAKAWILNQITSAVTAMNTQITENKNNIATNTSDISALKTSVATNTSDISALQTDVAGKADKVHTHSASDITSGTLPIANGGTGTTTAKDAFMNLANGLSEGSGPKDTECMIYKNTEGTNWGLYTLSKFWNYIKGKIATKLVIPIGAPSSLEDGCIWIER